MNIRIGDIVRFISEKMEGKVTGIIDNTTVNIFVDDYGFEIPASTSDLVVIHSDFTPSNIKYIDNQLVTVIKIQMICKCKYKTI